MDAPHPSAQEVTMGITILICTCGKRVKAPGARPGRVGRCPACGSVLEVSEGSAVPRSGSIAGAGGIPVGSGPPGSEESEQDTLPAGGYSVEPARCLPEKRAGKPKRPAISL